jgi:alkanesulfonate monooxygenase SsuD/methylene tetrahydromethanopterin reductase-like flavin-dependent oxidoreductase (luciferase family)
MEKMTKKEMYALIAELCAENADVVEFCHAEIARLDTKAEKAKAKAAEKKAQGDELYRAILSVLTSEAQTREDVLAKFENEDGSLTVAKIGARLSQAVKNGDAEKEVIKVDGKNKTCYKLA